MHTVGVLADMKEKKLILFVSKGLQLEIIIMRKTNQFQKDKYHIVTFVSPRFYIDA